MKKYYFFPILFFSLFISAQNKSDSLRHWHRGGTFALNFAQASFTNWAAGGENSISGQTRLNLFANFKKDSTSWENGLDLGYGILQQGKGLTKKTDDKIDFTSKYGRYAFKRVWYYSVLFGFKTQFLQGYDYKGDTAKTLISDFMSPGYLILAAGLDYKPNEHFSFFTAPITGKTTIVKNQMLADAGAFGMNKALFDANGNKIKDGQHVRNEFGGYVRIAYKADIMTNVSLTARCELFSNYFHNPQNVDVNAELLLTMKVNKWISASFNIQGIYDDDVKIAVDKNHDGVLDANGPRFQLRQIFGIGFTAKF